MKSVPSILTLAALALPLLAGAAVAQVAMPAAPAGPVSQIGSADPLSGFDPPRGERQGRVIQQNTRLSVGRSVTIDLPSDARDVIVTNPAVVQAIMRGSRRLVLVGLGDGSTDVTALSGSGLTIANVRVLVSRDLDRLTSVLREVLPTGAIHVRSVGNSILLTGEVDNAQQSAQATQLAQAFASGGGGGEAGGAGGAGGGGGAGSVINALSIRGRDQVMLRVTVAEVQRRVLKQLGINSYGNWQIENVALRAAQNAAFPVAGRFLGNTLLNGSDSRLNADGSVNTNTGKALNFQALEQADVARVLAEPNLTAISGEKAEFLVGGEVPIPTGAAQAQGQSNNANVQPTIDFKKFGVSLSFTPIVLDRGRISLNVSTEVSEADTTQGTTIPTSGGRDIQIPGFRVRRQSTTVEMPSGSSIVTAGLIQNTTRQAVNGFPGLMNLPVLGTLFRSRDYQRQETELMIIVTPYIAKPVNPRAIQKPTDGLRDAGDANASFIGQINQVDPADPLAAKPPPAAPLRRGSQVVKPQSAPVPVARPQPAKPPFILN